MGGHRFDRRSHAPATLRNREPILAVLRRVLAPRASVLEVGSGSGEHALYFSSALPELLWQPSDVDPIAVESIAAWRKAEGGPNLLAPVVLDVTSATWPVGDVDAVFSANMIHIAPWQACLGLLAGCRRHLRSAGVLVLYGPFRIAGELTAPSNEAFDRDLRLRDPGWGVRDLGDVEREAAREGLHLVERVVMPANNQTLVFRRD